MALIDILQEQLSPEVVRGIGQQLGIDQQQTGQAISALLPMMIGGLSKNTHNNREGMVGLSQALERDHDGSMLDHIAGLLGGAQQSQNSPLAGLLQNAAGPAAATMLGGLMGGRSSGESNGAAADMLAGLLGGGSTNTAAASMLGGLLGSNGGGAAGNMLGLLLGSAPTSSRASNVAGILGHMLGGQTTPVQQSISKALGLDAGKVGMLMTLLAPMVMGALGKAKRKQNLDPQGLANLLDLERRTLEEKTPDLQQGGLMDLLGRSGNSDQLMKIGGALAKNVLFGR